MRRGINLLLIALGAAIVSVVMILISHYFLPRPPWAQDHPTQGWTIYPPLSALPQAVPNQAGPTWEEFVAYNGLLAGATVAAAVALLFWFAGLLLSRSRSSEQVALWMKLLPVFLLVPCGIHLVGMGKYYDNYRYEQERILEGYYQLDPNQSSIDSLNTAQPQEQDSVDDSLDISQ